VVREDLCEAPPVQATARLLRQIEFDKMMNKACFAFTVIRCHCNLLPHGSMAGHLKT
jgi:hypothetical protein